MNRLQESRVWEGGKSSPWVWPWTPGDISRLWYLVVSLELGNIHGVPPNNSLVWMERFQIRSCYYHQTGFIVTLHGFFFPWLWWIRFLLCSFFMSSVCMSRGRVVVGSVHSVCALLRCWHTVSKYGNGRFCSFHSKALEADYAETGVSVPAQASWRLPRNKTSADSRATLMLNEV